MLMAGRRLSFPKEVVGLTTGVVTLQVGSALVAQTPGGSPALRTQAGKALDIAGVGLTIKAAGIAFKGLKELGGKPSKRRGR